MQQGVPQSRGAGRPRGAVLTEAAIARAALALIDEHGWEACTMAALARRLGVSAPSLYHHVESREDLIDLVRALVVSEIELPDAAAGSWTDGMRAFGISYHRAFSRHPNTIQLLSTSPLHDPSTLVMYEAFLGMLVAAGWDARDAFDVLVGLEHLALGFAFEANASGLMIDPHDADRHDLPLLAAVTRGRTDQAEDAERTFLAVLDRYIASHRPAPPQETA